MAEENINNNGNDTVVKECPITAEQILERIKSDREYANLKGNRACIKEAVEKLTVNDVKISGILNFSGITGYLKGINVTFVGENDSSKVTYNHTVEGTSEFLWLDGTVNRKTKKAAECYFGRDEDSNTHVHVRHRSDKNDMAKKIAESYARTYCSKLNLTYRSTETKIFDYGYIEPTREETITLCYWTFRVVTKYMDGKKEKSLIWEGIITPCMYDQYEGKVNDEPHFEIMDSPRLPMAKGKKVAIWIIVALLIIAAAIGIFIYFDMSGGPAIANIDIVKPLLSFLRL